MRNVTALVTLSLVATFGFSTTALADAILVPEPGSMSLFAGAAIALVLLARKFKLANQR